MRRAVLLVSASIAISGCTKPHGDVLPPDRVSPPRVGQIMVSDSGQSGSIPQKVFLTSEDRLNWLSSKRVKNSLKSFDEFEKLFPEIATQIGRALMDCKSDSEIRSLILVIGFIANHTPTRPLQDFGVLESHDDISLYLATLFDHGANQSRKLGVLALMTLSLNVYGNLFGNPSDVFSRDASPSKGQVTLQLEALREDPTLRRPIDCFLHFPNGGVLDTVPISQLSALRAAFGN